MIIESLLKKQNLTKYRLAVQAGVPHATLNDICSGKTKLEKCSAETVYKLVKVLGVSMELLTKDGIHQTDRERAYECGLPEYLQCRLMDCFCTVTPKQFSHSGLSCVAGGYAGI